MEKGCNVGQIFDLKVGSVLARVVVVIFLVEPLIAVSMVDRVLRVDVDHVNGFTVVWVVLILVDSLDFIGPDFRDGQVFQHLETPLRCSAAASDSENHGAEFFGDFLLFHLLADLLDVRVGFFQVEVLVRTVAVE